MYSGPRTPVILAAALLLAVCDADSPSDIPAATIAPGVWGGVARGPTMPAHLTGVLRGRTVTLVVEVNDTIAREQVVLGPVSVVLGREPKLGPCPICATPGTR